MYQWCYVFHKLYALELETDVGYKRPDAVLEYPKRCPLQETGMTGLLCVTASDLVIELVPYRIVS